MVERRNTLHGGGKRSIYACSLVVPLSVYVPVGIVLVSYAFFIPVAATSVNERLINSVCLVKLSADNAKMLHKCLLTKKSSAGCLRHF